MANISTVCTASRNDMARSSMSEESKDTNKIVDEEWYSEFEPEPEEKDDLALITTEPDRANIRNYQDTGSLLGTKMLDDIRSDFLVELNDVVSPKEGAEKLKDLMNAEHVLRNEDGEVIARKPDLKTQMKAFEAYADITGIRAPQKSIKATLTGGIESLASLTASNNSGVIEGKNYAAQKLAERSDKPRRLGKATDKPRTIDPVAEGSESDGD